VEDEVKLEIQELQFYSTLRSLTQLQDSHLGERMLYAAPCSYVLSPYSLEPQMCECVRSVKIRA